MNLAGPPRDATRRRDLQTATSGASSRAPAGAQPPACPGFVGRDDELDRLLSAYEAAAGGRTTALLVSGEAGIGKSRLVEEFSDRARLLGAEVARGVCVPVAGGLAYAPVAGLLRDVGNLGKERADGLWARLTPQSESSPAGADAGAAFAKTALFESVLKAIVELAHAAPIVLVVEDLQWVDPASSQLIDFLVRNLGDARVLIVGTYRAEEFGRDHPLSTWLAEVVRHPRVLRLDLMGLDKTELALLVADRLGHRPNVDVLESVWTRSQGNPFFAEELIAAGGTSALPGGLQEVIQTRIRTLPAAAQHILNIAATAGAEVDHRILAAVASVDDEVLDDLINEAIDKKILVTHSATGYAFRHALLREAVYNDLLPARRRKLHRLIATQMAADPSLGASAPGHRAAQLAAHWWSAGDFAAALQPSVEAADAATAMSAFTEALTFLERALLADEHAPAATAAAGVTRAGLLARAAQAAYLASAHERAVELAQAAVDAVNAREDPIAAVRGYTTLGRNMWGIGDSRRAFEAYAHAIQLLPAGAPSVERARVLAEEARGYMLLSQSTLGEQRARAAISAAREAGAKGIEGHALNTLGCCRAELGFTDEGIDLVERSLAIAEELAIPEDLNRAYGNLTHLFVLTGRLEEAASKMFDIAAIGEDLWGVRLEGATGNGVDALVRLGRYLDAQRVLAQIGTHTLGVCAPGPWTLPAPMMIRQGRFELAEEMIATAREMTAKMDDVQQAANVLGLACELALERGRPADGLREIERALALAARSEDVTYRPELFMLAVRAIADAHEQGAAGTNDAADELRLRADDFVAIAAGIRTARAQLGTGSPPRLSAAEVQTRAERSRLDRSDAGLWGQAADTWAAAREPYPRAYCLWREAEAVLDSRHDRVRAARSLSEAWQLARALGAEPLRTRVVALAELARLELRERDTVTIAPNAKVGADLGLTPREVEVLDRLAVGCTDREIAETLFISKKTVSVHVSNVLRKLSVARRGEAGKIGRAHGLG